jgi:DNA ligase-1
MKIYKLDTKGKIRFVEVTTVGSILIQTSGVLDTLSPVIHKKECVGKNIGKSNQTSPSEQAILEGNAIILDKLTEGYFKTIEECKTKEVILPMLAKSFDDEEHKIDWSNCFIQPKLDGMRCLAHISSNGNVELISRDGKVISNMEHIMDDLSTIKQDIILDGELYGHGLSFQENMKLIKKWRKETPELIKYHVYDLISTKSFKERKVRSYIKDLITCKEVSTYNIKDKKTMLEFHGSNIKEGYEGSIIRWGNEGYKSNGRSSNLLKFKDFQDIDAEIIDILSNEANPLHGTPVLKYSCKKLSGVSESTFKAGVKMSHSDREDLLTNRKSYIGKVANIRFFEWTDDGNPRFPVMIGIHEDRKINK